MKNKYFYLTVFIILSLATFFVGWCIVGADLKDMLLLIVFTILVVMLAILAGMLLRWERKSKEKKAQTEEPQTPEEQLEKLQAEVDLAKLSRSIPTDDFDIEASKPKALEDSMLANEIADALKNEEFTLYYQPKVTLSNGKIIGLEALIRWNSPTRGLVSPGQFLPVAASSGIISDIGKWVIDTVSKTIKDWIIRGFKPLPVAINLSAKEMENPDLLNYIVYCCDKYCIERSLLEFEIAQIDYLADTQYYCKLINNFKSEDFLISIDDFGTEMDGTNYLKDIPCDGIKLDKSFLKDLMVNANISTAKNIIALAGALDINVVCECVETQEQVDYLIDIGCTVAQGYYFSKPMSSRNATELLKG